MPFSYKPLWKLLIDRDLTKKALMDRTGISRSTIEKMNRGENVSMEVIERLCRTLNCDISDIVFYTEA